MLYLAVSKYLKEEKQISILGTTKIFISANLYPVYYHLNLCYVPWPFPLFKTSGSLSCQLTVLCCRGREREGRRRLIWLCQIPADTRDQRHSFRTLLITTDCIFRAPALLIGLVELAIWFQKLLQKMIGNEKVNRVNVAICFFN